MSTTVSTPSSTGALPDLARDYLGLDSLFSAEELALRDRVRAFVDERISPTSDGGTRPAHFPRELLRRWVREACSVCT